MMGIKYVGLKKEDDGGGDLYNRTWRTSYTPAADAHHHTPKDETMGERNSKGKEDGGSGNMAQEEK